MSTPTIAIPVWRSLALMPLGVAIVALMVTQPLQAQSTPQPCTTRANYDQAKAAADAADAAFKKLKEPNWSKLHKGYEYEAYIDSGVQDLLSLETSSASGCD